MNFKKYSWMAVLPLFLSACQEDTLVNNDQQQGIYTLSGKMSAGSPLSRAQIELGNQGLKETAFWNEGDSFGLIQESDGNYTEKVFTISSDYKEATAEDKSTALFTTTTPVISDSKYVAVYPAGKTIEGSTIILGLESTLTFSPTMSDETVWKNYFKNNMYMMASDTLESQNPSVEFKHLCALARVTYTNKSGVAQTISRLSLGGDQLLNNMVAYDLIEDKCYPKNPTTDLFLNTNNLTVANGASTDLYMFFFPSEFGTGNLMITIKDNDDNLKTVSLPVADIQGANDGATGFEAGKRYWFKVTETETGLAWSKDCKDVKVEVGTIEKLKEVINIDSITHILLTNPLVFNEREDFGFNNKTVGLSENFNWGDEDALFVNNSERFAIYSARIDASEKIEEGKYLFSSSKGTLHFNDVSMYAKGKMNAIKAVDIPDLYLYSYVKTNKIEVDNGYALHLTSSTEYPCNVYIDFCENSSIKGNILISHNYNSSFNPCNFIVENAIITGNFTRSGDFPGYIYVEMRNNVVPDGTGWIPETISISAESGLANVLANNFEKFAKWNAAGSAVEVSKLFVEGAESLDLNNTWIKNLDGLEYFKNLKILECDNNDLTSLNLTGFTKLETLKCNGGLLQELIVPSSITHLECERNQLTELDLTSCLSENIFLLCGEQVKRNGEEVTLTLKLSDAMMKYWKSNLKNEGSNSIRVELYGDKDISIPSLPKEEW